MRIIFSEKFRNYFNTNYETNSTCIINGILYDCETIEFEEI